MIDLPYMCEGDYPAIGTEIEGYVFEYPECVWRIGCVVGVDDVFGNILLSIPVRPDSVFSGLRWVSEWRRI